MALRLIIDGYNLMHSYVNMGEELEREALVEKLVAYKKAKQARITIIFDARGSVRLGGSTGKQKGVEIIFAPKNSDADAVIRNMAEKSGKGLVIVTSDSALARACERKGAVVIDSNEFINLADKAEYAELKGLEDDEDDLSLPSDKGTRKKGQPRKLSKEERERINRLKKM